MPYDIARGITQYVNPMKARRDARQQRAETSLREAQTAAIPEELEIRGADARARLMQADAARTNSLTNLIKANYEIQRTGTEDDKRSWDRLKEISVIANDYFKKGGSKEETNQWYQNQLKLAGLFKDVESSGLSSFDENITSAIASLARSQDSYKPSNYVWYDKQGQSNIESFDLNDTATIDSFMKEQPNGMWISQSGNPLLPGDVQGFMGNDPMLLRQRASQEQETAAIVNTATFMLENLDALRAYQLGWPGEILRGLGGAVATISELAATAGGSLIDENGDIVDEVNFIQGKIGELTPESAVFDNAVWMLSYMRARQNNPEGRVAIFDVETMARGLVSADRGQIEQVIKFIVNESQQRMLFNYRQADAPIPTYMQDLLGPMATVGPSTDPNSGTEESPEDTANRLLGR